MAALDPTARSVLAEGRQLHVGVLTRSGPHVTPELYGTVGDDLWFATAASTLKHRVLQRDSSISGLVRVGSRALVLVGEAKRYDPADPRSLVGGARDALRTLQAVGAFSVRNAADLGGFARDLVAGRLPSRRPERRMLVRLRPRSWVTLDGTALGTVGGDWPGRVTAPDVTPGLPGDRDAVVAWQGSDDLLLLPARLRTGDGELACATAAAALGQLAGLEPGTADAAIVTDDYRAPGPAAKVGTLLRGSGSLRYDGTLAHIELTVHRETTWDGATTRTEDRSASSHP